MSSAYNRPTRVNRSYRHPPTERLRNVNRPPRESRERVQFRRTVLRMFSCPFREESTCRNEATPFRCWFGHGVNRTDDDGDTANSNDNNTTTATTTQQVLSCNVPVETVLRPVPPYACIYSMMGFCDNETRTFENSSHQSPEIGCITGLHLTPEEFVDLDYFENKHSELIRNFYSEDHDLECSVCFDKVLRKRIPAKRRFGILEGCLHIFCSTCISEWRSRSFNCPVCRVYSSRVKFRARFVKTMEERKLMFPPVPSHFLPTPPVPLPPDLNLNLPDELPGADEMFVIRPYGYSSDDDYDEEGDSFYEDNPFGEPVQNVDPVIWNDDDRYDDDQFFERSGDEDSDYSYDYEDYRDFHENMFELLEFIENQAQPEQQLLESFSWTSPMSTNDGGGGGSTNAGAGSRGQNRGRRGRGRGRGARGRGRGGRGSNSGTSQPWNEDGQAPAPAAANLSTSASAAPPVVLRSGYARIVNSPPQGTSSSSSTTTTTSASTTSPYELRSGYIQLERSSQPNSITSINSSSSNHRGGGGGYANNNRSNRGYGGRGSYGDTRNQNGQNRFAYSNQPQPQASSSSSEDWTSPSSDPHHNTTQQTSSSRFWTTNDNSQRQSSSQQPSQQQQRQNDRWHDDNNVNPPIINWTVDSDSEANDNRQPQRGRGRGGWDYGYGGRGNNRRGNNRGYNNSRYNRRQFW